MMANKYGQRDLRWKWNKMGDSPYTLGDYGCLLASLSNGLNDKGWNLNKNVDLTPDKLNEIFQLLDLNSAGAWQNFIDYEQLDNKLPSIFTGFEMIEPYPTNQRVYDLVNSPNKVVVGRVNAKGIGGEGDHFVLVTEYSKPGATTKIHDPWTNTEEFITKKYGKLGNLLGFRVFSIKRK